MRRAFLAGVMMLAPLVAQAKVTGIHGWPLVGAWGVQMIPNVFNTGEECWINSYGPPLGPDGYSIIFYVGPQTVTLGVNYTGPKYQQPQTISLLADSTPIATLGVMFQTDTPDGQHQITAKFSRDVLVKTILPAMIDQETITAQVGNYAYTVPIKNFTEVVQDYYLCSAMAWPDHQ